MQTSSIARIGAVVSILGGILIVVGFCLPVAFTSGNTNYIDTYPPVLNGWQLLSSMPQAAPLAMLAFLLNVVIIGTSTLTALRKGFPAVARMRTVAAIVSITVYLWLPWLIIFPSIAFSPDGAAASPHISLGVGIAVMLVGTLVSATGLGLVGVGAVIGALISCLAFFIPYVGYLLFIYDGGMVVCLAGSIIGALIGKKILRAVQRKRDPERNYRRTDEFPINLERRSAEVRGATTRDLGGKQAPLKW